MSAPCFHCGASFGHTLACGTNATPPYVYAPASVPCVDCGAARGHAVDCVPTFVWSAGIGDGTTSVRDGGALQCVVEWVGRGDGEHVPGTPVLELRADGIETLVPWLCVERRRD